MPPAASQPVRRRRHGRDLEAAILEATWTELVTTGYADLTMESVAKLAGTSESVLYRRWLNKDELTIAALAHCRAADSTEMPDTGSLREDLIALLTSMGASRVEFFAVLAASAFGGLLARTGLSLAQLRARIYGDQPAIRTRALYSRAEQRGEIDLQRTHPAVLSLPFDLIRHDLLMNPRAVSPERIVAVVDSMFLPLIETPTPAKRQLRR